MNKGEIKKFGIDQNNFNDAARLQDFNKGQIYTKGFEYQTEANTTNEFPIQLGGKARKLWGVTFFVEPNNVQDTDIVSLNINSEQLINNVIWWAYNPQGAVGNIFKDSQFFALPRNLSGADDTQLVWKSLNAHKIYVVFYLSDK
ncbi:MAG: hypothetical protein EKK64_01035 [Neisseriaceae bacterium]|nr:MAG: hypothetical protein EKK64_01035 [Neisseriaceae bacterium]